MNSIIKIAISEKKIIKFTYNNFYRIAEPHVYGIRDNKECLLVYQIGGNSKSGKPIGWRTVFVDKMRNIEITKDIFPGLRPSPTTNHTQCDNVIAVVK